MAAFHGHRGSDNSAHCSLTGSKKDMPRRPYQQERHEGATRSKSVSLPIRAQTRLSQTLRDRYFPSKKTIACGGQGGGRRHAASAVPENSAQVVSSSFCLLERWPYIVCPGKRVSQGAQLGSSERQQRKLAHRTFAEAESSQNVSALLHRSQWRKNVRHRTVAGISFNQAPIANAAPPTLQNPVLHRPPCSNARLKGDAPIRSRSSTRTTTDAEPWRSLLLGSMRSTAYQQRGQSLPAGARSRPPPLMSTEALSFSTSNTRRAIVCPSGSSASARRVVRKNCDGSRSGYGRTTDQFSSSKQSSNISRHGISSFAASDMIRTQRAALLGEKVAASPVTDFLFAMYAKACHRVVVNVKTSSFRSLFSTRVDRVVDIRVRSLLDLGRATGVGVKQNGLVKGVKPFVSPPPRVYAAQIGIPQHGLAPPVTPTALSHRDRPRRRSLEGGKAMAELEAHCFARYANHISAEPVGGGETSTDSRNPNRIRSAKLPRRKGASKYPAAAEVKFNNNAFGHGPGYALPFRSREGTDKDPMLRYNRYGILSVIQEPMNCYDYVNLLNYDGYVQPNVPSPNTRALIAVSGVI